MRPLVFVYQKLLNNGNAAMIKGIFSFTNILLGTMTNLVIIISLFFRFKNCLPQIEDKRLEYLNYSSK